MADKKKDGPIDPNRGKQLVLLMRPFTAGGALYEPDTSGCWIPEKLELPSTAQVWDEKEEDWVKPKAKPKEKADALSSLTEKKED